VNDEESEEARARLGTPSPHRELSPSADNVIYVNALADSRQLGRVCPGYLNEEGFLFLCDRKIGMIISGGANIYPAEIENVLLSHPKVSDVAVFGIPNDDWGEEIKAVVEPAAGAEPGDLTGIVRSFPGTAPLEPPHPFPHSDPHFFVAEYREPMSFLTSVIVAVTQKPSVVDSSTVGALLPERAAATPTGSAVWPLATLFLPLTLTFPFPPRPPR